MARAVADARRDARRDGCGAGGDGGPDAVAIGWHAAQPLSRFVAQTFALPDGTVPSFAPTRMLIVWHGLGSPPAIRCAGGDAAGWLARLGSVRRWDSALGEARAVPALPGFAVVALDDGEVLLTPVRTLATVSAPIWPVPSSAALLLRADAPDVKLGQAADKVRDFGFAFMPAAVADGTQPSTAVLVAHAPEEDQARALMRWIRWGRPVVNLAARLGVTKAKLPDRLLDHTEFTRADADVTGQLTMDAALRDQALEWLVQIIRKQLAQFA